MTTSEYKDDGKTTDSNLAAEAVVADQAPAPELQRTETDYSQKSVLILEDDPAQIYLLQSYLKKLQMKVIVAQTVKAARDAIRERLPDLAIFDVRLPDGSGLDLCEEVDADPKLAGMPIIVLSSVESEDMIRKTRASGGRFFLGKPYDPNVLLLVIESSLRG